MKELDFSSASMTRIYSKHGAFRIPDGVYGNLKQLPEEGPGKGGGEPGRLHDLGSEYADRLEPHGDCRRKDLPPRHEIHLPA